MRLARDRRAATTDEEIQVAAAIRLHHVIDIDLLIAAGHGRRRRRPGGTAAVQLGLRHVQVQAPAGHVELDHVAVPDQRQRPSDRRLRRRIVAPRNAIALRRRGATEHPMSFALTEERERAFREILSRYPTKMAACIPVLHLCQEQHGWVSDEICEYVAKRLELSAAHVKGVATFYSLFNKEPVGKHQVWVCRTLPCALKGAGQVTAYIGEKLGITPGETTADRRFTLSEVECLASCGTAPMMQVDDAYYEDLTPTKIDEILASLK